MDRPPADDRSALSLAWSWASRIIAVSAMMVVPALIGAWVDQKLGTVAVCTLIGLALGVTAAIVQLMRIVKDSESEATRNKNKQPPT
jgi:F0F1-type ATP synthase assembly protein I